MPTTTQPSSRRELPSLAEWRPLYEAATTFRDLAPWTWMEDWEYFGVQDPETGVIGYCYVTGGLGEHFSLVVNLGEEGLHRSWEMRRAAQEPGNDPIVTFFQQLALTVSFEDRTLLTPRDREVIKEIGLKFRGRNAWPLFRYLPNHPPWYLTAWEARFLMTTLREALGMAERLREDHSVLPDPSEHGQFLVRVVEAASGTAKWKDEIRVPQPAPPGRVRAPAPDWARVDRLASALPRTNGVVEFDCSIIPGGVKGDEEDRPYFPALILAADASSGMILGMEMVHPDAATEAITGEFLKILEKTQMLPARVVVQDDETAAALTLVARRLEIRLARARRLPAIAAARSGMSDYLSL